MTEERWQEVTAAYRREEQELLQKAVSDNEIGVLISTHLLDEISDMVDYINVLEDGRIVKSGSRFEILGDNGEKSLRDLMKG